METNISEKLIENSHTFIWETVFENVVCWMEAIFCRPQCVNNAFRDLTRCLVNSYINPAVMNLFHETSTVSTCSVISQYWYGAGIWKHTPWKGRSYTSHSVNTLVADVLWRQNPGSKITWFCKQHYRQTSIVRRIESKRLNVLVCIIWGIWSCYNGIALYTVDLCWLSAQFWYSPAVPNLAICQLGPINVTSCNP